MQTPEGAGGGEEGVGEAPNPALEVSRSMDKDASWIYMKEAFNRVGVWELSLWGRLCY